MEGCKWSFSRIHEAPGGNVPTEISSAFEVDDYRPEFSMSACLLAGMRKELVNVRRRDRIIKKTRDGRGQKSIWEVSV